MSDPEFDRSAARTVQELLEESSVWEPGEATASTDLDGRIGPSRARPDHTQFTSSDTEGQLDVTIPDPTGAVSRIALRNPLDPTLADHSGPFATALGKAHARRAGRYCRSYFEPLETPDLIATASIPTDFTETALESELSAMHDASLDVDDLHQQIWAPLAA